MTTCRNGITKRKERISMEKLIFIFPAVGALFFGIVFFVAARLTKKFREQTAKRCTVKTWAKIIDTEERTGTDSDGHTVHYIYGIYEYSVPRKGTIKSRSNVSTYAVKKNVGSQVKIYYNPNNPYEFFSPDEDKMLDIIPKIFYPISAIGFLIAIISIGVGIWNLAK